MIKEKVAAFLVNKEGQWLQQGVCVHSHMQGSGLSQGNDQPRLSDDFCIAHRNRRWKVCSWSMVAKVFNVLSVHRVTGSGDMLSHKFYRKSARK